MPLGHEQTRGRDAVVDVAARRAAQIDDEARRAGLGQRARPPASTACGDVLRELRRCGRSRSSASAIRVVTSAAVVRSRTSDNSWGSAALSRITSSATFEPGSAAQQPHAFVRRHVARGATVDGADVVAGAEPGLGRRRTVTRRDDAQVVLPRQLDADVRGSGARVAVRRP